MAGLVLDGSNPDLELLRDINGIAKETPQSVDRVVEFVGEYGLVLALLLLACWFWWRVARRREDAAVAVAGVLWSGLAAGVALVLNIPVRGLVERPRPFVDHEGLEVLIQGKTDFSFVSDHATLVMALAMGLFLVSRGTGVVAIVLALLGGLCRVYMGVHYPTDVVGGFALGTAVALLLAPPALAMLTPLMSAVERSRAGWLVRAPGTDDRRSRTSAATEKDLAA